MADYSDNSEDEEQQPRVFGQERRYLTITGRRGRYAGASSGRQINYNSDYTAFLFYKTRPCLGFLKWRRCTYGSNCKFAHSVGELRLPPSYCTNILREQPRFKAAGGTVFTCRPNKQGGVML